MGCGGDGQSVGGIPARRGEGSGPGEGPLGHPAGSQEVKARGYNSSLPCSSRAGLSFMRKGYFHVCPLVTVWCRSHADLCTKLFNLKYEYFQIYSKFNRKSRVQRILVYLYPYSLNTNIYCVYFYYIIVLLSHNSWMCLLLVLICY